MRRTLIGFLGGLSILFGLVVYPNVADAARTTTCPAGSLEPTHDTADDFAFYAAHQTDPGRPATLLDPGAPPTYSGGDFEFAVKTQAPTCANAVYTIYVFTDPDDTTFNGTGTSFSRAGNGSNPLNVTNGKQFIFDGYNNTCVWAHLTISTGGSNVYSSPLNKVCGTGGGGRIW